MYRIFNIYIPTDELRQYYRDRLFELVDFDATTDERKKQIGENRYVYIDRLIDDIEKNNKLYQSNGKTIGFIYGAFYTIIIIFLLKITQLLIFEY